MQEDIKYDISSNKTSIPPKKPALFWTRILRLSIYFTIFGIILAAINFKLAVHGVHSDQEFKIDNANKAIEGIKSSFIFAFAFILMGLNSVIVSIFMRSREKRLNGVTTEPKPVLRAQE